MQFLKVGFAAALVSAGLAMANPAFAHAKLVTSSPAANATVTSPPKTITLTFNERVVPAFSKFELSMPEHDMEVPVETAVSPDGKRIIGTVRSPLQKGSYAIHWTAAGSDGHKMEGHVNFKVG